MARSSLVGFAGSSADAARRALLRERLEVVGEGFGLGLARVALAVAAALGAVAAAFAAHDAAGAAVVRVPGVGVVARERGEVGRARALHRAEHPVGAGQALEERGFVAVQMRTRGALWGKK